MFLENYISNNGLFSINISGDLRSKILLKLGPLLNFDILDDLNEENIKNLNFQVIDKRILEMIMLLDKALEEVYYLVLNDSMNRFIENDIL